MGDTAYIWENKNDQHRGGVLIMDPRRLHENLYKTDHPDYGANIEFFDARAFLKYIKEMQEVGITVEFKRPPKG